MTRTSLSCAALAVTAAVGLMLTASPADAAKRFYHSRDSYPQIYKDGYDENAWGQRRDWRDDGIQGNPVVYYGSRNANSHENYMGEPSPMQEPDLVVTQAFRGPDRTVIYDYLVGAYGVECPNGLVQLRDRCVRPASIKPPYRIGRPLAQTITYTDVPEPLLVRLTPTGAGYRYVQVNDDVLLIDERDNRVIDAVTLTTIHR